MPTTSKAVLDAKKRKKLDRGSFAIPESRAYPIEDEAHARNALARVSQFGSAEEQMRVRSAVKRKYPKIGKSDFEATRRIVGGEITRIALCRRGANHQPVIYKSDEDLEFAALTKATEEGELLAVVYVPERTDVQGDVAARQVIKHFAHGFNRDHRELDLHHDGKVLGNDQAYVAESFIVAKGDSRFADWQDYSGNRVDLEGAWAVVIKLEDPALRAAYRDGELNGVSMFGTAIVEPVEKSADDADAIAKRILDQLVERARNEETEEIEMTKEEMQALLDAQSQAILAKVDEKLKPAAKPEGDEKPVEKDEDAGEDAGEPMPEFTGNPLRKADVEAYQAKLTVWSARTELAKAQKAGDAKGVAAAIAKLSELAEEDVSDEDAKIKPSDSPQVRALKRDLFKAEQASRQDEDDGAEATTLEKQVGSKREAGRRIAERINKSRGYVTASAK